MKGYIYKIINVENGHFYVGSTIEIEKRKKRHFKDLKNGRHHSMYLQRAYDKYGENSFRFIIIKEREFKDENELRQLEERYIKFCWKSGKLYNVSKQGSGGDLVTYHPLNDDIRKKHRENSLKIWENKTIGEKEAYSQKMRGRGNPNFGNKWTDEQKEDISRKLKEYYKHNDNFIKGKTFEEAFGEEKAKQIKEILSKCASEKVGEKNPFYGKHHSEETKKKISEARKGSVPPNAKKVEYNGIIYESAGICARELNMSQMTVCYRCRKEIMGFKYVK